MTKLGKFEHYCGSIDEVLERLPTEQLTEVLAKVLPRNANDKNQIYWSPDFHMLHSRFAFTFSERDFSTSRTKLYSDSKKRIPEGRFESFEWLDNDGERHLAPNVKMLIYAQYPEMRLSGFKTANNEMPQSLSVEYTKEYGDEPRVLILARTRSAGAIGMMVIPHGELLEQIKSSQTVAPSKIIKLLYSSSGHTENLWLEMKELVEDWRPGCRLDTEGHELPFNGTQVCGYTLERALNIVPNASKDGDYQGIELKTHTRKKVTLMTPEPDMGDYSDNFKDFMTTYGYKDSQGSYRFTGLHRAGIRNSKTGLTLKVDCYEPKIPFSKQLASEIKVGLFTDDGHLAAGWSLERLLNCWGAKHNETVYVSAMRRDTESVELIEAGYKYEVKFGAKVTWCRETNAERLLRAIANGVIILDPAPKYVPSAPGQSKRRSQWRVNDIHKALTHLYENVSAVDLL